MRSPRPTEAPLVVPSNLGQSLSHGCAVPAPVAVPKILCSLNAHRILTTATPFCSLLPPLAALANVPLSTREPWGTGDADRRNQRPKFWDKIWLAVATPQARRPCGPPRNDNGFLSFRGAERRGNPYFYDGRGFGPPYLGHGLRRPNSVPKFGASVKSSAPAESPIDHPSQPARSGASAPAAARDGRESTQEPSQKGTAPATAGAALSEAESAERAAGQIRSLPDGLRVQHGAEGSEVSARPRPCSR